jgi:hypothetical protein
VVARGVIDAWLGRDLFTRGTVAVWRLSSLLCGITLVAPIMNVGRRPYRLGRLADRLEAVRDMALIPDALPTQLRWFQVAVVTTVVTGVAFPIRFRRLHPAASLSALILAILVYRGATRSAWTEPTTQLTFAIAFLVITLLMALLPNGSSADAGSGAARRGHRIARRRASVEGESDQQVAR